MRKSFLVASLISSLVLLQSTLVLREQQAQVGTWQMTTPVGTNTFKMPKRMFFFAWPTAPATSSSVSSISSTPMHAAPSTLAIPQPRLAWPTTPSLVMPSTVKPAAPMPTQQTSSMPGVNTPPMPAFNRSDSWFILPRPQLIFGPAPSFGLPILAPISMPPMHGAASSKSMSSVSSIPLPPKNKPAPATSSMPSMPMNYCGDGSCNNGETATTCSTDCGMPTSITAPMSYCGDAQCTGDETSASCAQDCGSPSIMTTPPLTSWCGNATCESGETTMSCPSDCKSSSSSMPGMTMPWCGNGMCDGSETAASCDIDC